MVLLHLFSFLSGTDPEDVALRRTFYRCIKEILTYHVKSIRRAIKESWLAEPRFSVNAALVRAGQIAYVRVSNPRKSKAESRQFADCHSSVIAERLIEKNPW
ncbi:hypothetical protein VTN00DRAFT_7545 [Thermoascus crustaceus]|uniref:uncharacterized protein n=1 Tax=Thermoascus crustaceus TaxID=5088 RepID=UPI0037425418